MQNLITIVNSEQEYLDLIADAVQYGIHQPNPYAEDADKQGYSVVDSFSKLDAQEIYEMFGAYTTEHVPGTIIEHDDYDESFDDACSFEEQETKVLNRQTLRLDPDHLEIYTPAATDYPIVVNWSWADSFDRLGRIKERSSTWYSLSKVLPSHTDGQSILKSISKTWHNNHGEALQKWIDEEKRQRL